MSRNWKRLKATFPSFQEGSLRPTNRCDATSDRAQRARTETLLHDWLDVPGRAVTKVASQFLDRRGLPSFQEGNRSSLEHIDEVWWTDSKIQNLWSNTIL